MNRRHALVLLGIASALGGAAWIWKKNGLGREFEGPGSPLDRALAAARANGKVLLVVVAPDLPASKSPLGDLFGDVFQNMGDDMYEDFALCEVVCATRPQIRAALDVDAQAETVGLVELDGQRATWTNIAFDATPFVNEWDRAAAFDGLKVFGMGMVGAVGAAGAVGKVSEVAEVGEIGSERAVLDRAESNHNVLRAAIVPNAAVLAHRAEAVRRTLGQERTSVFLARLESGETLKPEELDDCAALVRTHATWPATRPALIHAARERLLMGAPRGSRWAASLGRRSAWVEFLSGDGPFTQFELNRRARGLSPVTDPPLTEMSPRQVVRALFDEPASEGYCGAPFHSIAGSRFLLFYTDEN